MDIATSKMLMFRAEVTQNPHTVETPDVLDLCVRKRDHTPSPDHGFHEVKYPDPPTSATCFSSPGSNAGSETSEMSCSDKYGATYPSGLEYPVLQKAKIPRPFKAYPKNPFPLAIEVGTAESVLGKDFSTDAYTQFRNHMLSQVQSQNQGTNTKMRRTTVPSNSANAADPTYWEKRRKNNEAAKRSRDARRAKEDEIAIRCAFLEQENLKLKFENSSLRSEMERLRRLLYN